MFSSLRRFFSSLQSPPAASSPAEAAYRMSRGENVRYPDPEVRDTALSVLSTYVIQDVARERIARHADTELDTRLQEYCTLLLCCGWS